MAEYTLLVADTLTGTFVGDELPLSDFSYDIRVNDAAVMSASLPVDAVAGTLDFLEPERTAIYVDRGGSIAYSGMLWDLPDYDSSTRTLQLSFGDFFSYWDHLLITDDMSFTSKPLTTIARSLMGYGMNKGNANLSPVYEITGVDSASYTMAYAAADHAPVGQRVRELSRGEQGGNGFDFRVSSRWEAGYPRRVVSFGPNSLLGYQGLGRSYPASGLVFDLDTDCSKWTLAKAGSPGANVIYGTGSVPPGATAGTLPVTVNPIASDILSAGYPRLESSQQVDTFNGTVLLVQARGSLNRSKIPALSMQLTLNGNGPDLGEFQPGDQAAFRVKRGDGYFRYGAQIIGTIASVNVAVNAERNEAITVGVSVDSVTQGVAR